MSADFIWQIGELFSTESYKRDTGALKFEIFSQQFSRQTFKPIR